LPFKAVIGIEDEHATKETDFAQPSGKSRNVLAKETAFVITSERHAWQFSQAKEIREQCCSIVAKHSIVDILR